MGAKTAESVRILLLHTLLLPNMKQPQGGRLAHSAADVLFDDPNPEDAFDFAELVNNLLRGVVIQIQHGVGVFAAAFVGEPSDVDVFPGDGCCEPAQRTRNVPVEQGDPALGGADAHLAVGIIDGVSDVAVLQVVHDLPDGHFGAVILGLLGGGPQVGDGDAAGHGGSFLVGEVRHIPADLAGGQSLGHGLVVHQQIPGKVQEDDAIPHFRQCLRVDHLAGAVQQRGVQGDDITLFVDFLPGVHLDDAAV